MEEKKVVKRSKAFAAKIGNTTYRSILLKLNKWTKQTGQNSVNIDIKEVAGSWEAWLSYGAEAILLVDGLRSSEEVMTQVGQLRRYLLDRKFKVFIKE